MRFIKDAKSIAGRDPAARGVLGVIFLYPGFHALIYYRVSHFFYRIRFYFIARLVSQVGRFFTGIEIHPGAKIGNGLFIDHGMGVVIGETAEIGDNCTLYHGCTLGGTGKDKGKRHPTLGNNVLVGAGAKILGPFRVGNNALIGANAVVLNEVPDGATVIGVPGHVIKRRDSDTGVGIRSIELDQTHTPDPISIELCKVLHRLAKIEKELDIVVPVNELNDAENFSKTDKLPKICDEEVMSVINKKV
ncbi:MAG: serine O-acetyltransferase EpsC [Saccharofermentanales bacterium]